MQTCATFTDLVNTNRFGYDGVAENCKLAGTISRHTYYRARFAMTGCFIAIAKVADLAIGTAAAVPTVAANLLSNLIASQWLKGGTIWLNTFSGERLREVGIYDEYAVALKVLNPQAKFFRQKPTEANNIADSNHRWSYNTLSEKAGNAYAFNRHIFYRTGFALTLLECAALKTISTVIGLAAAALSLIPTAGTCLKGKARLHTQTAKLLNPTGLQDIFACALKVWNPNAEFYLSNPNTVNSRNKDIYGDRITRSEMNSNLPNSLNNKT